MHNHPYFPELTVFMKLFELLNNSLSVQGLLSNWRVKKAGFDLAINFILILIPLSLEHPFC